MTNQEIFEYLRDNLFISLQVNQGYERDSKYLTVELSISLTNPADGKEVKIAHAYESAYLGN